jgi:hypothetical protein
MARGHRPTIASATFSFSAVVKIKTRMGNIGPKFKKIVV